MDKTGGSCFPSTKTLAVESGLSERVVCRHLSIAETEGWIKKLSAGNSGQAWRRNQYQALIPKALTQNKHLTHEDTDPKSAPIVKGTDFECKKALTQSQSNYSIELSSNKQRAFLLKDETEFEIDNDFFNVLCEGYPNLKLDEEIFKLRAWAYSNPQKRKTRAGAKRFVNSWMQRAAKNGQSKTSPKGYEL